MKLAIDARAAVWYRGTGIGTYTYQLLRNILPLTKISPILPEECNNLDLSINGSYNNKLYKDKFWEYIHSNFCMIPHKIDFLHVPHNGLGIYKTNAKKIITLHDIIPYVLPDTVGVYYHKVFLETMPRIVQEAVRIITVSHCSKNDICKTFNIPESKVDVIYEAPEGIYYPMDKSFAKKYATEKYSLNSPYILYIGGFSPRKNVTGLIEAYKKLLEYLPKPPKLVIVGKKVRNYQDAITLVEKYRLEDNVIFTGFISVKDLPVIYNGAEAFVYPSLYEGFGLPPLEAMACSTPTICSNSSSLPEVVGDGAYLVNPKDIFSITEAMFKVLSDKDYAARLSALGYQRSKIFTWEKTAADTLLSYNKVLKEAEL